MKKTLLTTTLLAGVASLIMSGSAFAHHPSLLIAEEMDTNNPLNSVENISDMHNEVVGEVVYEYDEDGDIVIISVDYEFMGQMEDNAASATTPTTQTQTVGGETSATMTSSQTSNTAGANNINRSGRQ